MRMESFGWHPLSLASWFKFELRSTTLDTTDGPHESSLDRKLEGRATGRPITRSPEAVALADVPADAGRRRTCDALVGDDLGDCEDAARAINGIAAAGPAGGLTGSKQAVATKLLRDSLAGGDPTSELKSDCPTGGQERETNIKRGG